MTVPPQKPTPPENVTIREGDTRGKDAGLNLALLGLGGPVAVLLVAWWVRAIVAVWEFAWLWP